MREAGSETLLPKISNYLKACPASLPRAQSASFLSSVLNSLQGRVEGQ